VDMPTSSPPPTSRGSASKFMFSEGDTPYAGFFFIF
jgi:hypothetical protein